MYLSGSPTCVNAFPHPPVFGRSLKIHNRARTTKQINTTISPNLQKKLCNELHSKISRYFEIAYAIDPLCLDT